MRCKRIISVVVLIIGVLLLCVGFYGKKRMAEARGAIDSTMSLVPKNPVKGAIKGGLQGKVDQYQLPITLCFVGGVIFILGGIVGCCCCCCKSKKRSK